MIPLVSLSVLCFSVFMITILVFLGILMPIIGIKAILKDGKARRRLEKQNKQNPNITITFRRDG